MAWLDSSYTALHNALDLGGFNNHVPDFTAALTSAQQFNLLQAAGLADSAGVLLEGNDVAQVVGYRLPPLPAGGSHQVAYALVAGSSLAELQQAAAQARHFYQHYQQTAPLNRVQFACPNDSLQITPLGGTNWRFTADAQGDSLLGTGPTLPYLASQAQSTVYIFNTDSLYTGPAQRLDISWNTPSAAFALNADTLLVNGSTAQPLSLTAQTPNLAQYQWQFGQGGTSSLPQATAFYTQPGTYTIQLTVQNSTGCTSTSTQTLTVLQRALAPAIATQSICKGSTATLLASNTDSIAVATSPTANPIFTGSSYTTPPLQQDTILYVSNLRGNVPSNPVPISIQVSGPQSSFAWQKDTTNLSSAFVLQLQSTATNVAQQQWLLNGQPYSQQPDTVLDYSGLSSLQIALVVQNAQGCTDTLRQNLPLTASPTPTVQNVVGCLDSTATISPQGGSMFHLYSSASGGTLLAKGTQFALPIQATPNTLYIAGADSLLESLRVPVQVQTTGLQAAFSLLTDTLFLPNATLQGLQNNSTAASTYLWQSGNGQSFTQAVPNISYPLPGQYNLQLTVADSLGCTSTTSQTITVLSVTSTEQIAPTQAPGPQLVAYPNPTTGTLYIKGNLARYPLAQVKVYNLQGQQVLQLAGHQLRYINERVEVPMATFQKGMYYLEVVFKTANTRHALLKVVKQ